jgi:hypothetical protein
METMNKPTHPIEAVETVELSWDVYRDTLQREYLDGHHRNGVFVLRLMPPFEETMPFERYFAENGVHYDSNWDTKPVHYRASELYRDATGPHSMEYAETWTVQNNLDDDVIEAEGGIETALENARQLFFEELWYDMRNVDLITFTYGTRGGYLPHTASLEWVETPQ